MGAVVRIWLSVFALSQLCSAQVSSILTISGTISPGAGTTSSVAIPTSGLWQPGTTNPQSPPMLPPLNQRVLRFLWVNPDTAFGAAGAGLDTPFGAQQIDFEWANAVPAGFQAKLEAPFLEVSTDVNPHARCNVPDITLTTPNLYFGDIDKLLVCTNGATTSTCRLNRHLNTYFTHPPAPNQSPTARSYRKLCVRQINTDPWTDTNLWVAVEHACDDAQTNGPTLNFKCDLSDSATMQVAWPFTGALAAPQTSLGRFVVPSGVGAAAEAGLIAQGPAADFGETPQMRADRLARRTCCGSSAAVGAPTNEPARWGTCLNNKIQGCCGWRPYSLQYEKCCSKRLSRISWSDSRCPCTSTPAADPNTPEINACQFDGPNFFTNARDGRGLLDAVNTRNRCCVRSVYWELLRSRSTPTTVVANTLAGSCYNLDSEMCCAVDGAVYDAGSQQCCSVNGVQSLDQPCPCNIDSQCGTGKRCCVQAFPPPYPPNQYPNLDAANPQNQCNVYANYPTGSGNKHRCFGRCYSTTFQICCNGQVCVREYDKCCNSTCCNRHTASCMDGYMAPAGANARLNPLNFRVPYEQCSEIENLTARRTLFVFVFPTMFLLATLISLAIVIILARRATEHYFELVEQAIVFFGAAITLLACGFYFSPVYKYGIVISFIGLFAIVTAVIRRLFWSIALVLVIVVLVLFLVDPFAGNIYLSFSSAVPPTGGNVPAGNFLSHSMFEAIARLILIPQECTGFYDWFRFDAGARDFVRMQNPQKNVFGYCTRAWLSTLIIFLIFIVLFTLCLLSLSIMSVVKKLAPPRGDDVIQLEVKRGSDVYAD